MDETQNPRDKWEIVYDSAASTTFIYRSVHAGMCGPFTEDTSAADHADAEAQALRYGLMRSGAWVHHSNGTHCAPAERVDPKPARRR